MAKEVRTTKTLAMQRMDKFKLIDAQIVEAKKRKEEVEKKNLTLADSNSKLHGRMKDLEAEIECLSELHELLCNDVDYYVQSIAELKEIHLKCVEENKKMYAIFENKIEESEGKLGELQDKALEVHKKSVEEQDVIQTQKKDLEIYQGRLQKKYDELKLGKVIL